MDYSLGALAILKQQETLRQTRERNRDAGAQHGRSRDAKPAARRFFRR